MCLSAGIRVCGGEVTEIISIRMASGRAVKGTMVVGLCVRLILGELRGLNKRHR